MQRCPVVPTAPKSVARIAISKSAFSVTIIALLPPSSRMALPNRSPTIFPTLFPTLVEPVAEISGILLSAKKSSPIYLELPATRLMIPSGRLFLSSTFAIMLCTATAQSMVFEDGFHSTTSPQIKASIAFQDQTATGKLKADITPTIPNGCHCSNMRWSSRSEWVVMP